MVNFIWFTDEKNIYRRSPKQYAERQGVRGRWSLQERCDTGALAAHKAHCSHSVMASVGVSALSRTNLHFVDPGVKINGQYYRDTLLMRDLLPGIKQSSPDYFMFQQDGAPTHRARETVNLLIRETPDFTRWAIISGPPKFFLCITVIVNSRILSNFSKKHIKTWCFTRSINFTPLSHSSD